MRKLIQQPRQEITTWREVAVEIRNTDSVRTYFGR